MHVQEGMERACVNVPGAMLLSCPMATKNAATLAGCTMLVLYMCLLVFVLPLADLSLGGAMPAFSAIAMFAVCALAGLVAIRLLCSRMRLQAWRTAGMLIALIGTVGFTGVFALTSYAACIAPMAVGTVCACFGWYPRLECYVHSSSAKLIALSVIIAMAIIAILILFGIDVRMLAAVAALSAALSLALSWSVAGASDDSLLEVTAAQSRQRAVTARVDRWTYTTIGVNLGFAIELARRDCAEIGYIGWPGEQMGFVFLVVVPVVVSASFGLLFRKDTDYTFERYSKTYLAFCVALFALPLALVPAPMQAFCIGALVVVSITQLIIMINASIEFIRFEELNPAWYMGEMAFAGMGLCAGAICFNLATAGGWNGGSLLYVSIALVLFNIFVKPRIDEGVFPSAVFFDSLFEDAKYNKSIEGKPAQANEEGGSTMLREQPAAQIPSMNPCAESTGAFGMPRMLDDVAIAENCDAPDATPALEFAGSQEDAAYVVAPAILDQPQVSHGRASWRARVAYICEVNALSPRQIEIFELLAKGRDAKFIQDTFCISKGTTKTHIYNIYRKLDVHSRQDLIDMVEAVTDEQVASLRR